MVPQRVSLVTIGAVSVARLRAFYQGFGWSETAISSDNYAVFQTAGVLLSIYPIEDTERDSGLPVADKTGVCRVTLSINVDTPEEVDLAAEQIRKAGGTITKEPSNAFWGGRTLHFLDPENNQWEVAWNPTAVFDERGAMLNF